VIRIRRVRTRVPLSRLYEVELSQRGSPNRALHVTRSPTSLLEATLGIGDAWSFVDEADRQWDAGNRGWAVEFEERPSN
jgi:hypothetical protein